MMILILMIMVQEEALLEVMVILVRMAKKGKNAYLPMLNSIVRSINVQMP